MKSLHFVCVLLFLFCSCSAFLIFSLHGVEGYACHAGEREALLSLRQAALSAGANYGDWTKFWDGHEAIECCEWPGVRCDEVTGRVISLQFGGCSNCYDVSRECGALPSAVARLESLQVLDLRTGCFSAAIPALTLASLTNLTHLDLSDNWFSKLDLGAPDLQLVQLLKLTYLDLSYNIMDSQLNLSQLASFFPNLTHLDLSANSFSKLDLGVPDLQLVQLLKLTYLDLSYNAIDSQLNLSQLVSSFPNLTHLDLRRNSFSKLDLGAPDLQLVQLLKLTSLDLSYNAIESLDLSQLMSNFPSLTHLDLSSNDAWGGVIPEQLSSLQNLTYLELSENHFQNPLPWRSLSRLSRLKHLGLGSEKSEVLLWEESKAEWPCAWQSLESLNCINMGFETSNVSASLVCLEDPTLVSKLKSLSFTSSSSDIGPLLRSLSRVHNNSLSLKSLSLRNTSLGAFQLPPPPSWSKLVQAPFLETLMLGSSGLTSIIPLWLDQQLPLLRYLDISGNNVSNLSGLCRYPLLNSQDISFCELPELPRSLLLHLPLLETLHMKDNSFTKFPSELENLVHLRVLDMSGNLLSGVIPPSIGSLSSLQMLVLKDNRLSGAIPVSIGNLSSLMILDLSANRLSGHIPFSAGHLFSNNLPANSSQWGSLLHVNLSHNQFSGSISQAFRSSLSLESLVLSNNRLSGSLLELFHDCPKSLFWLDLSDNSFSGALPWWIGNCSSLQILNLARNSLSSMLPTSLGQQLEGLEALILHNNQFTGEIPRSLQNCTSLKLLDLGYNQLTGQVPEWITGKNFGLLQVLMLNNNQLEGSIPLPLVQSLNSLQILVLANNFLSGPIPSTINHLQGMATYTTKHSITDSSSAYILEIPVPDKGMDRMMGRYILSTFTTIDLSSNSLEGNIPPQIGALQALRSLNLSHNKLNGSIPSTLGNPSQALESLDLSNNKLIGGIPHELCTLHFLSTFNISSNWLQGEIPQSSCTQLSGFDASSFSNNDGLCGPPLPNQCLVLAPQINTHTTPNKPQKHSSSIFAEMQKHIALGGVGIGYPVGLLTVGLLLYFKYWHR